MRRYSALVPGTSLDTLRSCSNRAVATYLLQGRVCADESLLGEQTAVAATHAQHRGSSSLQLKERLQHFSW